MAFSATHDQGAGVRTALVVGATGVAGSALVDDLAARPGWHVIALAWDAKQSPETPANVTPLAVDLFDREALKQGLAGHAISHVFYAAQAPPKPKKAGPENIRAMKRQLRIAGLFVPALLRLLPGVETRYFTALADAAGINDPALRNRTMLCNVIETVTQPPPSARARGPW